MRYSEFNKENEYPFLLTISTILYIVGIVVVIIAAILLIYGLYILFGGYSNERMYGILIVFSSIVCGLLFSIPYFAFSELIKVFIRIECNTRKNQIDEKSISNHHYHKTEFNDNIEISYEEWKKINPGKTLNDFYRERKR